MAFYKQTAKLFCASFLRNVLVWRFQMYGDRWEGPHAKFRKMSLNFKVTDRSINLAMQVGGAKRGFLVYLIFLRAVLLEPANFLIVVLR